MSKIPGYTTRLDEKDSLLAGDSILESTYGKHPSIDLGEGSFSYLPSIVGVGR